MLKKAHLISFFLAGAMTNMHAMNVIVGTWAKQGNRVVMEDAHVEKHDDENGIHLIGIFDGHSGKECSQFAAETIANQILDATNENAAATLINAFLAIDTQFIETHPYNPRCGTTALVGLIDTKAKNVYIANAGDSRAVIANTSTVGFSQLTRDHKASDPIEKKRIEKLGGWVGFGIGDTFQRGEKRYLNGYLEPVRGFGNAYQKPFAIPDPEVVKIHIDSTIKFLILASDGLWDVMNNEDAVLLANAQIQQLKKTPSTVTAHDAEQIAKSLISTAQKSRARDNVTVAIVFFQET